MFVPIFEVEKITKGSGLVFFLILTIYFFSAMSYDEHTSLVPKQVVCSIIPCYVYHTFLIQNQTASIYIFLIDLLEG